ncbi:UDP-N-acetylmuramyl tripeptide synthase [Amycolatopsis bartoniae]|uniref:MurT ligase domain-containing protein n=1 Tax=Amycolatopsis bartoniae TaxID=941986 RepID=UPI0017A18EC6|nr:MurT ligase domain-containing protein [Amycolatopsis bartoniae]MBB2940119.1 UDP-N-acetylmuramyl tripeptide synthase [Amycolatopsis bartoniae]
MATSSLPRAGERTVRTLPARTRLAVTGARLAAAVSRGFGAGDGGMIGGLVALKLDPAALRRLGHGRVVVLVTGTNGKTTTALMLSRILESRGPVALNADGANMPAGVAAALAARPDAPVAVLEVDENYVPYVAEQLRPACLVLLNLSRDQLDRTGEVRALERELRAAVSRLPETTVVANCDDPLIASVGAASERPVWVAAGQGWHADALACARCGQAVRREGADWDCVCGLARPVPGWTLDGDVLTTADGHELTLGLRLPGRANAANAAAAVAAAAQLGVTPLAAVARLRSIGDVAGRYRRTAVGAHAARLLLAKNPAGWRETLPLLDPRAPVVIAVNSREADGRDVSWLWDVPFEQLRGRPVVATGERASDLAVRLLYAEVPHTTSRDPLAALADLPPGPVELVANYTAFRNLKRRLGDG